jgi:hypothetical protein
MNHEYVITWSQYLVGDEETEGYSWMGPGSAFVKHFKAWQM